MAIIITLILQPRLFNTNRNEQDVTSKNNGMNKMIFNETNDDLSFNDANHKIEGITLDNVFKHSALCGRDSFGITLIEYSCLSYLAYSKKWNDTVQSKNITEYLKRRGWEIEFHSDESMLSYVVGYNIKNKVKIISFKGTDSINDLISDVKLFGEAIIPKAFNIIPLFTKQTLQKVSYVMSFFGSKAFPTNYNNLINIAKNEVNKYNESTIQIVLTGHSLGGAIANVVGSDIGLANVGISPPGIYLGTKSFGIKKKNMNIFTRVVIPENDLVASMGIHGGVQINIPCYDYFWKCHNLKNTLCTIAALCHEKEMNNLCKEEWNKWNFNSITW
ncbi:hypothetical protein EDI_134780 [Entamoeba dispar SAW760]|uniref:Fungal lipase-type domain-containing protein n=1 Tax=Entamoeba dispar (strain ATCC PRA-260 / SAW760) TaxID=370354 RepID=B0EJZ1_ENTDS|nr:uncharacterized protein EDI_134780 [Entamoeba dispar SAW760]EDR25157.1 hypothetical protein EDI_134780 [Entamoeba dispar SAW760]|eukprot:EDR25157.1 hypothetical protein EDI_134780 [Entamoeba dispar SAW760]